MRLSIPSTLKRIGCWCRRLLGVERQTRVDATGDCCAMSCLYCDKHRRRGRMQRATVMGIGICAVVPYGDLHCKRMGSSIFASDLEIDTAQGTALVHGICRGDTTPVSKYFSTCYIVPSVNKSRVSHHITRPFVPSSCESRASHSRRASFVRSGNENTFRTACSLIPSGNKIRVKYPRVTPGSLTFTEEPDR
eukprot:Polyplicarium_translucidae@DN3408_c1_g1_i11.p1